MRTLHKQYSCRSAGALSRRRRGEGRAGERSGRGVRGGRRPSLAAMAAEELAQATRRAMVERRSS
eukprot:3891401-Prymnesium_polylepis.1